MPAAEHVPTFTHFLDLPILLVIIMLGALRPETWIAFAVGLGVAVMVATVLTVILPRLYPWAPPVASVKRRPVAVMIFLLFASPDRGTGRYK